MKPKVLLISILLSWCAAAQPPPGTMPPELPILRAGTGLIIVDSYPSRPTVSLDSAVSRVFLTSTARLSFSAMKAHTCRELTMPAAFGAVIGDSVAPAWPNTLNASLIGVMFVSAPDVVTVRLCNTSASTVTTAPWLMFSATIVKTF